MNILDLFRADETEEWPSAQPGPVLFDLGAGTFAGIGMNADYQTLSDLGRPANRGAVRLGRFVYPELGLQVGTSDGRVTSADFEFRDTDIFGIECATGRDGDFEPCVVQLRRADGAQLMVSAETTAPQLTKFLGSPISEERDPDYFVPAFEYGGWHLEFEFSASGELHTLRLEPPGGADTEESEEDEEESP